MVRVRTWWLDVATLSKHFDEVGAEGTYLMKTQAHTLPDGSAGAVVYILPKYTLEYAKSRRADMLSMLHLALAESSRDVEQACASKVTGVYDINRHMYLRRTFVAVHVRDDASIVDGHKHFVEAGGFSEHAVFVKYLRSPKKADARPVRSGPASSGPGKRKRKFQHPKPKRSVALRVMLRAPASQTTVPEKGPSIEPDHDEAGGDVECSLCTKPVDGLCMATRADGKRCTKQRLVGGYCRQHEKLLGGDKGHGAILKSIPVWVPSAVRGWFSAVVSLQQQEDAQFAEACRRSLSGDAGRQDRVRRSREILDGRLVPRGLQRVPTAALGDCLFVAVAQTAGLEITHQSLRAQACDYMDRCRRSSLGFST